MASRVPRNIPVTAIASLLTGGAATGVVGYMLYNSVFSGALLASTSRHHRHGDGRAALLPRSLFSAAHRRSQSSRAKRR